ncbi:hypothetical protein HS125_10445 [bacterium]|nr:hypothetical protein [bacterium]
MRGLLLRRQARFACLAARFSLWIAVVGSLQFFSVEVWSQYGSTPTWTPTPTFTLRPTRTPTPTWTRSPTPTPGPPSPTWTPTPTPRSYTLRVPADAPTIQTAIDYAIDGDQIIVSPGVYEENIHFKGKRILIRSTNVRDWSVIRSTIIDGGRRGSVVTFAGTERIPGQLPFWPAAELYGFTIRNGSSEYGGGIRGNGAQVNIEACRIEDNWASRRGGGLYQLQPPSQVRYCYILRNRAGEGGGGMAAADDGFNAYYYSCLIYGNEAPRGGASYAGGRFEHCTIVGNRAELEGGGTWGAWGGGVATILWNNVAGVAGGDIYAHPDTPQNPLHIRLWGCCLNLSNSVIDRADTGPPYYPNFFDVDPLFVDSEEGDFHLRAESPVIDAFVARWPGLDLDFRQGGVWTRLPPLGLYAHDLGCYEYYPPVVQTPILATNTFTPTSTPPPAGDIRRDGRIDALDLFELSLHWNGTDESSRKADLDQSGTVDAADLLILIEALSK